MQETKFEKLHLSRKVQKALDTMGFEELTPIQEQAIPLVLGGSDIIGQAQTGTVKRPRLVSLSLNWSMQR